MSLGFQKDENARGVAKKFEQPTWHKDSSSLT